MDELNFRKEFNFRDLGGYEINGQYKIKKNKIYRSAALGSATDQELEQLKLLHIHTILDLRSEKEAERLPEPIILESQYIRMNPAMDDAGMEMDLSPDGLIQKAKQTEGGIQHILKVIRQVYESAPFQNDAFMYMFEQLKNNQLPMLIHCSAGKDRTGIACMLIMLLLGADDETVIQEYLLTNLSFEEEINKKLKKHAFLSKLSSKVKQVIYCSQGVLEENARYTLEGIKRKYGSYEAYFEKEYHLDLKDIQRIRNVLLEK